VRAVAPLFVPRRRPRRRIATGDLPNTEAAAAVARLRLPLTQVTYKYTRGGGGGGSCSDVAVLNVDVVRRQRLHLPRRASTLGHACVAGGC
jgi:hypothetical protein